MRRAARAIKVPLRAARWLCKRARPLHRLVRESGTLLTMEE
jgi:hypothetical protein